jgi:signal transduction histidine kinase
MPRLTSISSAISALSDLWGSAHGGHATSPDRRAELHPLDRVQLTDVSSAEVMLLPVAIFVVALLAIGFSHVASFVGTVWPTNAIILVELLRHRRNLRNYGSILLGSAVALALAGVVTDGNLGLSIIITATNLVEVATAWALLSLLRIDARNMTSFRNLIFFIFVAGGIAPICSAVISAIVFGTVHNIPWLMVWRTWYPGHALGMIIVGPFLISVTTGEWRQQDIRAHVGEAAAFLVLLLVLGICGAYFRPLIFVVVPLILFATIRFGLIGATLSTFVTAILFSGFVVLGVGHAVMVHAELSERIFALQIFLAITSLLAVESQHKSDLVVGLRRHLSMAEENERLRLSHELHDQAGQSLIAAILELNQIDAMTSGAAHERLQSVRKTMEEMGKTLHRIAWELRPPSIDELGLRKALASYIADWSEQCGTEVDFHCDDPRLDDVPGDIGTAIYRIVQEGLTNVVKHAEQPSSVSVVIRRVDTTLHVIIEDNGCGFDVGAESAKSHGGLGLHGMRERLLLIGGTLEIESSRGSGTTIFARIALEGQRSAA